jgi:hypothetical protein
MTKSTSPKILLIEDSPLDPVLARRALKRNLANSIQAARDSVEALKYVFCEGSAAKRRIVKQTASRLQESHKETRDTKSAPNDHATAAIADSRRKIT